jgi:uncharacterized membrane protein YbhN (UPF0104 family)
MKALIDIIILIGLLIVFALHILSYLIFQDQPSNFDVLVFLVAWIGVCANKVLERLPTTPESLHTKP